MPAATALTKKVAFLDRDGTINQDTGFVHKKEDWQFVPGAIEALQTLQTNGFTLAIVTNQSGIAHGLYTRKDMETVHNHMLTELNKHQINISYIASCTHHREGNCDCRKPKLGMIERIEQNIGSIDFTRSWTIGDKIADFQLGQNAGTKTALIKSKYWQQRDLDDFSKQPDLIANDLFEASRQIND